MFISEFRLQFLVALLRLGKSASRGMFIDSCFAHCQTEMQGLWHMPDSPLLNKSVSQLYIIMPYWLFFSFFSFFMLFGTYSIDLIVYVNWGKFNCIVIFVQTIAKAVGDWFYDRNPFQKIDCAYPCNPTCHNRVYDPQPHADLDYPEL